MSSTEISLIVFACVFSGALVGMFLRAALPLEHLTGESKDVVRLAIGLIGTMAALVLGLLVASAKTSYDTQKNELTEMSAKVIYLDRVLAEYGPETKEVRNLLRSVVNSAIDQIWTQERSRDSPSPTAAGGGLLYHKIHELSPKNDTQRSLQSQALSMLLDLGQTRMLMFEQGSSGISMRLLAVVVFWLTIIFISFGLYARPNATVIATLFFCALSVAGAIHLILEMYTPFQGMIQISSAPLRSIVAHIGQ